MSKALLLILALCVDLPANDPRPELLILGENWCAPCKLVVNQYEQRLKGDLAVMVRVRFMGPNDPNYKRLNPPLIPAFYLNEKLIGTGFQSDRKFLALVKEAVAKLPLPVRAPIAPPPVAPAPVDPPSGRSVPVDLDARERLARVEERLQALWNWPAPEVIEVYPRNDIEQPQPEPPEPPEAPHSPGPAARLEPGPLEVVAASVEAAWNTYSVLQWAGIVTGISVPGGAAAFAGWQFAKWAFGAVRSRRRRSQQSTASSGETRAGPFGRKRCPPQIPITKLIKVRDEKAVKAAQEAFDRAIRENEEDEATVEALIQARNTFAQAMAAPD
jgi:hypothetical protein